MKYRESVPILAIGVLLQIFIGNLIPGLSSLNFLMCFGCVVTIMYGNQKLSKILIPIFLFQLILDSVSGFLPGIGTLTLGILLLTVLLTKNYINNENAITVTISMLIYQIFYINIYWKINNILGITYSYFNVIKTVPIFVIENTILIMIIYFVFRRKTKLKMSNRRKGYFR